MIKIYLKAKSVIHTLFLAKGEYCIPFLFFLFSGCMAFSTFKWTILWDKDKKKSKEEFLFIQLPTTNILTADNETYTLNANA